MGENVRELLSGLVETYREENRFRFSSYSAGTSKYPRQARPGNLAGAITGEHRGADSAAATTADGRTGDAAVPQFSETRIMAESTASGAVLEQARLVAPRRAGPQDRTKSLGWLLCPGRRVGENSGCSLEEAWNSSRIRNPPRLKSFPFPIFPILSQGNSHFFPGLAEHSEGVPTRGN